jgi:K+-transporting ATPase KdpF subunit
MNWITIFALVLSLILLIHLVVCMLFPEKF